MDEKKEPKKIRNRSLARLWAQEYRRYRREMEQKYGKKSCWWNWDEKKRGCDEKGLKKGLKRG